MTTKRTNFMVKGREYRGKINCDVCEERLADFGIRNICTIPPYPPGSQSVISDNKTF